MILWGRAGWYKNSKLSDDSVEAYNVHHKESTMENEPGSDLDLEAFVSDIESDASQQVYAQRYIHPPVSIAGPHSYDPEPMDPQALPPLEDDTPVDDWE